MTKPHYIFGLPVVEIDMSDANDNLKGLVNELQAKLKVRDEELAILRNSLRIADITRPANAQSSLMDRQIEAINSRIDNLYRIVSGPQTEQAAAVTEEIREEVATEELVLVPLTFVLEMTDSLTHHHEFMVEPDERTDVIVQFLNEEGYITGTHYSGLFEKREFAIPHNSVRFIY